MGEATDRKVTEIEANRSRLEADLRELEARLPAPIRSMKSVLGLVGGTALAALLLRRHGAKRANTHPPTEVVVRVVREDE